MKKTFTSDSASSTDPTSALSYRDGLSRRERGLWRAALLLLFFLAIALAASTWDGLRAIPWHLEALPMGLVVLVALFVYYAYSKTNEIAELRGLVRGIEHQTTKEHNSDQLDQLFSLISRSQQGYRDMIDTFEDLLFSFSLDGTLLTVNRSFADLVGLSFTEVVGRSVNEFFEFPDPALRVEAENLLPRFLERRRWTGLVCVKVKKLGSTHYLDCVFHAILRDGEVRGVSGIARDVTRERESETRFTELFHSLREGVYLASAEDNITEANPALAEMLGFANSESLIGTELSSCYRNPLDRVEESVKLAESGFLGAREVTLKHRQDGREVVALHSTTIVRDKAGKFVRYQGTLLDITEQRAIERRLQREQEFARRMMDSFPDIVVTFDTQLRYTFASPQVIESLGYRPEELIGRKLGDFVNPEDHSVFLETFGDMIAGRRADGQVEFRAQHKNGMWRDFRISARPLHDEAGKTVGIVASARDITEQNKLQQQVIQSERLAAMGQMIAGVAHELNNPLTAILGVTELVRDRMPDDATRRHLELAHRQARRAAHIVQDLLVFSRPAAPRNTVLHLGDVLQHTLQLHENSLRSNQIQVDLVARPDLPTVLGDVNQLTQVFLNLIVNAEQAILEIRKHGTLRIRLGVVGERVLITFQDDGVGIQREMLPRIFDPFFTTKRPGRGSGLGLSICMAIVREHHGDISAQPLPDGGSVFTVSLPMASQPASLADSGRSPAPSAEAPVSALESLAGKKILVVDDEEGICELVAESLKACGVSVDCAASSDRGLEYVGRSHYDAILSDLHLVSKSGMAVSGFDLHAGISRSSSETLPHFIIMTGDMTDPGLTKTVQDHSCHLLQKPFRMSQLLVLLSELLAPSTVLQSKNSSS